MSVSDVCSVDVQTLYLEDPGNKADIAGYILCSEMGNTCVKNGCSCRSAESAVVNGSTTYFAVCVVLKDGADCVTSGDDYVTCATDSISSGGSSESQNESNVAATTKATTESNSVASTSTSNSGSGAVDAVTVSSNASSAESMSMTVMIVIIVVAVVFVALVSWVVRSYCVRRSAKLSKLSSRRNRSINFDATSPTNVTGRTSATPSFPAFDRRTRAMQSPVAGGRGRGDQRGANTPRGRGGRHTPRGGPNREPNSGRGNREPNSGRGRRNPDLDFGRVRSEREAASGHGRRKPEVELGRIREPHSGRGRKNPDLDFNARGRGDREPNSGRRNPDMPYGPKGGRGFGDAGMQREPNSGRGRRSPDMPRGKYQVELPMRPDRTPPRDQRVKQHASPRPAARPTNKAPEPPGGTVFTGRNTYERVAQFAQLAAFEAPPPPPPRPQRPIQPVKVADAVPKHARGPPPNVKPGRPAPPKRPGFYIPEDPAPMDYASMSPKTARSLAPSVASSATTIVAQGRNRPTPLQQGRRQQYAAPPPRFQSNSLDDSGFESKFESKFEASGNNYDDSFVSEVSSMAWSGASGLSDDSYYHAAGSNTARIPVIDAPHDDDDGTEADNYSDWGHSTQASDAFRSTAASDASFFSVNSDFTDTKTAFKEREF